MNVFMKNIFESSAQNAYYFFIQFEFFRLVGIIINSLKGGTSVDHGKIKPHRCRHEEPTNFNNMI